MTEEQKETDNKFELAKAESLSLDEVMTQLSSPELSGSEPDVVRQRLRLRCALIDKHYLDMGMDLHYAHSRKLYLNWKYESMEQFVYSELGRSADWLKAMIEVWSKFKEDLAIPHEEFEGIGYTKIKEIRKVVNKNNVYEWLDVARKNNMKGLKRALKTHYNSLCKKPVDAVVTRPVDEATGQPIVNLAEAPIVSNEKDPRTLQNEDDFVKVMLSLAPEQFRLYNQVLMQMQAETGSIKDGHNLCMALMEFLMTRESQLGTKEEDRPTLWMRAFEQRFGGKLVWIKNEEQADFLRAAIESNKTIFDEGAMTDE